LVPIDTWLCPCTLQIKPKALSTERV